LSRDEDFEETTFDEMNPNITCVGKMNKIVGEMKSKEIHMVYTPHGGTLPYLWRLAALQLQHTKLQP
jgi:hypothetical protein